MTRVENEFDFGAIHVQPAVQLGGGLVGAKLADLSAARGTERIIIVSDAVGCDLMDVGSRFNVEDYYCI